MHKMLKISAETYIKNCIYNIIEKEKSLWHIKKTQEKNQVWKIFMI